MSGEKSVKSGKLFLVRIEKKILHPSVPQVVTTKSPLPDAPGANSLSSKHLSNLQGSCLLPNQQFPLDPLLLTPLSYFSLFPHPTLPLPGVTSNP